MGKTHSRQTDPEKDRYWRALVQGHEGSGQSVRAYCRQAGVKESAFYWWRRELAGRSETREATRSRLASGRKSARTSAGQGRGRAGELKGGRPPRGQKPDTKTPPLGGGSPGNEASPFVPVHLLAGNSAANAAAVEIHLGDGRMVRVGPGVDRQTLVEVLGALEARPC